VSIYWKFSSCGNKMNPYYPHAINIPFLRNGISLYVITAFLLGWIGGGGIMYTYYTYSPIGLFLITLVLFHISEFIWVSLYHPKSLSWDSFLLNHSVNYCVMMSLGFLEYIIESTFLPQMKTPFFISIIGFLVTQIGGCIRLFAMFTAKSNFDHLIATQKEHDHNLVTHGIYYYCRHPGYAGWFLWAIGTQIIMLNPVCLILYTWISWMFLKERILMEEKYLVKFFGSVYENYRKRTRTYIPGIY